MEAWTVAAIDRAVKRARAEERDVLRRWRAEDDDRWRGLRRFDDDARHRAELDRFYLLPDNPADRRRHLDDWARPSMS